MSHGTRNVHRNERGASAVEYALIATLIAIMIIGVVGLFGAATNGLFERSCRAFPTSSTC